MRSSLSFLLAVLVLSCVPAVHGSEPAAATGSVAGTVRTSDGAALPHVAVLLRGDAGSARVTTGPDGAFRIARLAAGEYDASVDAPGLALTGPAKASIGGEPARLDLVLSAAPVREHVVVSATRSEATSSTLGAAVDVLDRERIEERAAPSLLALVQELPGVATARAGGTGLQGSVFIRGGESRYARVLVDGVAVNQPGGAFDFGTALPFEIESIEVLRGAASSLYGSDALAGVVSLTTRRATGRGPVAASRGRCGQLRLAPCRRRDHGDARRPRLERRRAATGDRQRRAEQRLRRDLPRACDRRPLLSRNGRARRAALRRRTDRRPGTDRLRQARSRRLLRAA